MAAATLLVTSTACSAGVFRVLGSVLTSCRATISAPYDATHFWAHAAGSWTTSAKGANAASGHSSGGASHTSMAILGI